MAQDTTYNGWRNYPTWNFKLWMDNDQGSQEYWQERARHCYRHARPQYPGQTDADAATAMLADEIEASADEMTDDALPDRCGPISDILSWAMGQVDWREIAESLIGDVVDDEIVTTEEADDDTVTA